MKTKSVLYAGIMGLSAGLCGAEASLLPNGDFEEGMYDWESPTWPTNSVVSKIAEEVSAGKGRRSLLLEVPAGKNTCVLTPKRAKLPAGIKEVTLNFEYKKTPEAKEEKNGSLEIKMYFSGKVKSYSNSVRMNYDEIKTDWTKGKLVTQIKPGTELASVWIMYSGSKETVKVYVDNFEIKTK